MKNEKNNINFLNELSAPAKTKYQEYVAEMGISRVKLKIPFEHATLFEKAANSKYPQSEKELLRIVEQFNGIIIDEA